MDVTAVDWEKEKRIKKEREKAAKDLLEQEAKQNSVNQGYFPYQIYKYNRKAGYVRDPEVINDRLEFWAGVGLVFTILRLVFLGILLAVDPEALGEALTIIVSLLRGVGELVGMLVSVVVIAYSIVMAVRKKARSSNALITAIVALTLQILATTVYLVMMISSHV